MGRDLPNRRADHLVFSRWRPAIPPRSRLKQSYSDWQSERDEVEVGAKKHIPLVDYPGELGEPHVRIKPASGLFDFLGGAGAATEAEREAEAQRKNLDALGRKMALLADYYDAVNDDRIDWKKLAIELAIAHVAGFTTIEDQPRKPGRPGKGLFNFDLYRAVLNVLDDGEPSVINACRTLSKRTGPWKGANPSSLEARFHESKRRAAAMDFRSFKELNFVAQPDPTLGALGRGKTPKPSDRYPPPPLFSLGGMFDLSASALYDHEKS